MQKLHEVPLSSLRPKGFLAEYLKRQTEGLSGHFKEQKYPFDSCLWEGKIQAYFRELDYNGNPLPLPGENRWWPYEQTGYLLDGLLRLGILAGEESMVELFKRNLDYLLAHSIDNRLGGACYGYSSEWPMGVFFKGVRAYIGACNDQCVIEAFRKHYHRVPVEELGDGSRNITNIEGLLFIAEKTGDDALRQKAFDVYDCFNTHNSPEMQYTSITLQKLEQLENIVFHGVTLCEEIKVPVLLYLAGGERRYLAAAQRAWDLVMKTHGQIPGLPCSVEHAFGRDPDYGYETCVISDSLYSLGFFAMAGDKAVRYADQMEKIAYNAAPGAVTRDFGALQYFSAPNQVLATPFSNGCSFLFGIAPLRQYRPDHFAACCAGNVHRAMPNFISRMWMLSEDESPAAVCYGPVSFEGKYNGSAYSIDEKTEYPFNETIRFSFKANALSMPVHFRIPEWCGNPRMTVNGRPQEISNATGTFVTIERVWNDGDCVELTLPMNTEQKCDRHWSHFERGPLVYSLPIKHSTVREEPEKRFTPLIMKPESEWNYAVAPNTAAKFEEQSNSGYPFENPPVSLTVPAKEIFGAFSEVAHGRFTPKIPLFAKTGNDATLRLVPYGATETRLTAFPDGLQRELLPTLSAFTIRTEEMEHAEALAPEEFRRHAHEIQIDPDGYFDLARFYRTTQNASAWLQIRFYSETERDATAAVIMSDGGIGFMDGRQILSIPSIMEAQFMEPLWFKIHVRKGFNHLLLRVEDGMPTYDHRDAWGAKALFFI